MADYEETIIDSSKANAGRVYDYILGGDYNFEVDRKAAEALKKLIPNIEKTARLIRWFLGVGIRKAVEWGFTQFLDFASGLPTVDHIHTTAPKGSKVIYSDIDPVTVQIGKEIIGDNTLVKYETCDAAVPEKLLESEVIKKLFGRDHKAAIGFNGVCYFLSNDRLSHAMKVLYDWVAEGSVLFLTDFESLAVQDEAVIDLYKNMKQPIYIRESKAVFTELVKPWKIREPGFLKLEEWHGWAPEVSNEIIKRYGGGGLHSGFLYK